MTQRFTSKAENALRAAERVASELGHTYIGSEHLLYGLAAEHEGVASRILEGVGIYDEKIKKTISRLAGVGTRSRVTAADLTPRARRIIELSAEKVKRGSVGTEHLLLALLSTEDSVAHKVIASFGVDRHELLADLVPISDIHAAKKSNKCNDKARPSLETLKGFGRDLVALAEEGRIDPVIGRDREIQRLIRVLSRRTKNNPCLVGEAGVGKTAVAEALAMRIAEGSVPDELAGKRILSLDLSSVIAGAKYRGEFEERMKHLLDALRKDPDILLFIDEIHTIVGAGAAEGAIDAANILKPAMARGEIRVIGATTLEEYRRHIERDAALERRFQAIAVEEPTPETARDILRGLRGRYEEHHGVRISDEALEAAIDLSCRYLPEHRLPDKAIDLIDEAASELRMRHLQTQKEIKDSEDIIRQKESEKEEAILSQNYERATLLRDEIAALRASIGDVIAEKTAERSLPTVTPELIAETLEERVGIPIAAPGDDESAALFGLEETLAKTIVGQEDAIAAVSRAVRRARTGMRDPHRPIGSFLFLGPSGVGKTALCRALASSVFGSEAALLSFDMSEYMEKHPVSRLIGAPPGYLGHEEPGLLTERVRRHPYAVVLFDEIEKAHPDVYNLLLQILEDGILTDSHGRTAEFRQTIVVMTSNLGAPSRSSSHPLGFADIVPKEQATEEQNAAREAAERYFRPELLNRLDEIVVFRRLTRTDITRIAERMLDGALERIRHAGFSLAVAPGVVRYLAERGYSPEHGARALRRTVTSLLEDRFSSAVIEGSVLRGHHYLAEVTDAGLTFRRTDAPEEAEGPAPLEDAVTP